MVDINHFRTVLQGVLVFSSFLIPSRIQMTKEVHGQLLQAKLTKTNMKRQTINISTLEFDESKFMLQKSSAVAKDDEVQGKYKNIEVAQLYVGSRTRRSKRTCDCECIAHAISHDNRSVATLLFCSAFCRR